MATTKTKAKKTNADKPAPKAAPKARPKAAKGPSKAVRAALAAVVSVQPPEIPVDKLVGEARALAASAKKHQGRLTKVGLTAASVELVAALGQALAEAQEQLAASRKVGRSAAEVKADVASRAYRTRTLEDLTYALVDGVSEGSADAEARIAKIREGEGLDDLISDLGMIVAYVAEAAPALRAIGQDPKKLAELGAQLGDKLAALVDERRARADEVRGAQERDRVATALSAAMSAVRRAGRYAFRDDPEKQRLYVSAYSRVRKAVFRAKQTRAKNAAATPAATA